MSQAEPSAPPGPEPDGGARTTTATADAPTPDPTTPTAVERPRVAAAPAELDEPARQPADDRSATPPAVRGDGTTPRPADAEVHRRFWGEEEPAPTSRRTGRRGRRARRQLWVVRNISTWSVLKVSILFFACMWAVLLVAGTLLWQVASRYGLIGNLESFWAEATGSEEVTWDGEVVFRSAALATGVLAVASVAFATLLSVLFNLICDMTGGIRFTVLQAEPRRPSARRSRSRS